MTTEELTYKTAIAELGQILDELEASEIDVDVLSKKVSRGNELITFCQTRLTKVADDVSDVIEKMGTTQPSQETQ